MAYSTRNLKVARIIGEEDTKEELTRLVEDILTKLELEGANGIYFDKLAGHWRVRMAFNGEKQKHLCTTHDKTVAYASYDLFIHLNGLQNTHQFNLPRMTMIELYELIEERDPRALKNLMKKSRLSLTGNDNLETMGSNSNG